MNAHSDPGPQSQASDQPWVTGNDVKIISHIIIQYSERGVRELMMELSKHPFGRFERFLEVGQAAVPLEVALFTVS